MTNSVEMISNSPTAFDKISVTRTGTAMPNSTNSCSLEYFASDFETNELLKLMLGRPLSQTNLQVASIKKSVRLLTFR